MIKRVILLSALFILSGCADVMFRENPYVYNFGSATFDTNSMLDAEFYKVVLVLDPSNSMNDDLEKLSDALDQVIESSKGYNVRFYVYNTDSNLRMRISGPAVSPYDALSTTSIVELLSDGNFLLNDGTYVERSRASISMTDWTSYEYTVGLKPAIAIFEITKNSAQEDIDLVKDNLAELVKQTNPVDAASDEYGICTIRRILSEKGPNRILYPGDKVNFILISDENNGGHDQNERCSSGGVIAKGESVLNAEWCMYVYEGTTGNRNRIKIKDCNYGGYNTSTLVNQTEKFAISTQLKTVERRVNFSYRSLDTIVKQKFEREIDYNYEKIVDSETNCGTTELNRVHAYLTNRSISTDNLIDCKISYFNSSASSDYGSFVFLKDNSGTNTNLSLQNQTFSGKHCKEDATFFDVNTGITHNAFRYAVAARMIADGRDVDPLKLSFAGCSQRLSIEHLGDNASNPLAFQDTSITESSINFFELNIKRLADDMLGVNNYKIASFHHSADLDSNLGVNSCVMDTDTASYGVNQNAMIASLGSNGYRQSLCAPDFSAPLKEFAYSFIKDQNRTFTIHGFRDKTEITSIKVNGIERIGPNSYRLVGNKIILGDGLVVPGDAVEVGYRYPVGMMY